MKTALKTFAIIGIVFCGLGIIGNVDNPTTLAYAMVAIIVWLPLAILALVYIKGKK